MHPDASLLQYFHNLKLVCSILVLIHLVGLSTILSDLHIRVKTVHLASTLCANTFLLIPVFSDVSGNVGYIKLHCDVVIWLTFLVSVV